MTSRTRQQVANADVSIDTIVDGDKANPAIVLLPSLGRDSEDFDVVAAGLARDGLHVLRPQPRGILGSRGLLTGGITQHDFARDVAEVIRQLGGGRAVVAGHAYGNWVARQTATDWPDLVRGVILVAAAARNAHTISVRWSAMPAIPHCPKPHDWLRCAKVSSRRGTMPASGSAAGIIR